MKLKRIMAVTLASVVLATTFVGCGPKPSPSAAPEASGAAASDDTTTEATSEEGKKIINVNNTNEPGTLHPGLAEGMHESWVIDHCFEGLFKKTSSGEVVNGMADTVTISEDGLTYTITLRDDAFWSNGDPVVAKDFTEEWLWVLNPDNAAIYAGVMYIFQGAEAYNTGAGTREEVAIKAIDDKTIEFTLNYPMAYIQDYMTHYTFHPVNYNVQAENPDWHLSGDTYVSNGPFVMTSWKHKDSIDVTKNEHYYDAAEVKIDGIHYMILIDQISSWQAYQTGQTDCNIDIPGEVLGQLMAEGNEELIIAPKLGTYYLTFNTEVKPFNNPKVRQALSMSIDRNIIVETVSQGGEPPAYGLVPPGIPTPAGGDYQADQGPLFTEDIATAKTLLAEGLAEEGMTIEEFKPTYLYSTNDLHKRVAEALQNMWKTNLGIDLAIESVEFQILLDRRNNGDYEIARAGWIGDYVDPMTFLDQFMTDNALNETSYANPAYDELIRKAQMETDPTKRFEYMQEAEKMLINDMPIMPIYFYTQPYTLKPYITGVYKPVNTYPVFTEADIAPHE